MTNKPDVSPPQPPIVPFDTPSEILTDFASESSEIKDIPCGSTKLFEEKKQSQQQTHCCDSTNTFACPLARDVDGCSLLPTQSLSPNLTGSESISKPKPSAVDYANDLKYMESVVAKLPVDWPRANDVAKWRDFEGKVEKLLPKSDVDAQSKLVALEQSIYSVGVQIFGVRVGMGSPKRKGGASRRVKECKALILEKNSLRASIETASCVADRNAYQESLISVVKRLRVLRRAEKKLRNKRAYTRAARSFHSNPYKYGKEILNPSSSTSLLADKASLDEHRKKTLSDPFAAIPLESL